MLDIKLIKENPQDVKDRLLAKGSDCCAEIDHIIELDAKRREYVTGGFAARQVFLTACADVPASLIPDAARFEIKGGDIHRVG